MKAVAALRIKTDANCHLTCALQLQRRSCRVLSPGLEHRGSTATLTTTRIIHAGWCLVRHVRLSLFLPIFGAHVILFLRCYMYEYLG